MKTWVQLSTKHAWLFQHLTKGKEMEMNTLEVPEVVTVAQCPFYLKFMSEKALRWKLFADAEFRRRCSRKLGKRLYVLPREIVAYIKEQSN